MAPKVDATKKQASTMNTLRKQPHKILNISEIKILVMSKAI